MISSTKPHSTKRTLHIFDSIQSIFQTNSHNHSFNERHHHNNNDKKYKHNHTLDHGSVKQNSHRHSDSHKSNNNNNNKKDTTESDNRDLKKNTVATATVNTVAAVAVADPKKSSKLDADTASKMQNVTRILINSTTNPNQSNGNYAVQYAC